MGTPLYAAPELLDNSTATTAIDVWALGVIIYQMHVGKTPFFGRSLGDIFLEVQAMQIEFPSSMSADTIGLIQSLLKADPAQRLGAGQSEETAFSALKNHPYFDGLNFGEPITAERELASHFST